MNKIIYKVEADGLIALNMPLNKEAFELAGFSQVAYEAELSKAKWADIRAKRGQLMTQTDWTQMSDAPLDEAKQAAFAVYRQVLRDIPQTYDNPDAVIWPEKLTE